MTKPYRPSTIKASGGRPVTTAQGIWEIRNRAADVPYIAMNSAPDLYQITLPFRATPGPGLRPILVVPSPRMANLNGVPRPRGLSAIPAGVGTEGVPVRAYEGAMGRMPTIQHHDGGKRRWALSKASGLRGQGFAHFDLRAYGGASSHGIDMALASHVDSANAIRVRFSIMHPGYPFPDPELAETLAVLNMKEFEIAVAGCDIFGPRHVTRADIEALYGIEFSIEGEQGAAGSPSDSMGSLADLVKLLIETSVVDDLRRGNNIQQANNNALLWDSVGHYRVRFRVDIAKQLVRDMAGFKIRRALTQAVPAAQVAVPDDFRLLTADALMDRIAIQGDRPGEAAVQAIAERLRSRWPRFRRATEEVASFHVNAIPQLAAEYHVRAGVIRDELAGSLRRTISAELDHQNALSPVSALLGSVIAGFHILQNTLRVRTTEVEDEIAQRERLLASHPKPWLWDRREQYHRYTVLLREKMSLLVDLEVTREASQVVDELIRVFQASAAGVLHAETDFPREATDIEARINGLVPPNPLTTLDLEIMARQTLEPRANEVTERALASLVTQCETGPLEIALAQLDALVAATTDEYFTSKPADLCSFWSNLSEDDQRRYAERFWGSALPRVPLRDDVVDRPQVACLLVAERQKTVAERIQRLLEAGSHLNLHISIVPEPSLQDEVVLVRMARGIHTKDLRGFEDWQATCERVIQRVPPQRLVIHPLTFVAPFPHDLQDRHVSWLKGIWNSIDPNITVTTDNFYSQLGVLWRKNHRLLVSHLDQLEPGLKVIVESGWEV